jgi:hypothetical protein
MWSPRAPGGIVCFRAVDRPSATDPSRKRWRGKPAALSLTAEENRRVRAALANTSRAYGGRDVLASVMGVTVVTLQRAATKRAHLSGIFAIRLAKAAGVAVEAMLGGALTEAGACKTCGHRAGTGRVAGAGGGR